MANNTYSTPVINNFDAIKGDTNSPDTLSTEIKHGIQSPLLSTAQHFYKEVKPHYNLSLSAEISLKSIPSKLSSKAYLADIP